MSFKKIADMMFSRKSLPVLAVLLLGGLLFAVNTTGLINPPDKYQQIFQEVTELLEEAHFSPKKIDDAFSKAIFRKYLAALDDDRNIFLQSDIRELKAYETRIDDELHGAPIQFFYAVDQIYQKRLKEVSEIYKEFLKQPFTYNVAETFNPEPGDNDYPANAAARRDQWRKRLKYMCLDRYADLLDQRDAGKGQKDFVVKTDAQLEQEARSRVQTIMERSFQRRNVRFTEEERFNLLVNTVTETMDPHTRFFPPIEKRSFDEQMSGRFYGIGASLREEDGTIRIASLVTGMPAWKSGEFAVGDQVVKVGQGADEAVDVSGFEVEDAVKLIRGKKGTEVRLTLRKADGSVKIVSLIRDEIVLDETYARSAIVKQDGRRVGYIFLPEFYADWERPNGARSAQDVYKEILKLREQKVDGIIMDLRNNGGGSLYDVVQIAGFFIPEGPIVQVKDRDGNPLRASGSRQKRDLRWSTGHHGQSVQRLRFGNPGSRYAGLQPGYCRGQFLHLRKGNCTAKHRPRTRHIDQSEHRCGGTWIPETHAPEILSRQRGLHSTTRCDTGRDHARSVRISQNDGEG